MPTTNTAVQSTDSSSKNAQSSTDNEKNQTRDSIISSDDDNDSLYAEIQPVRSEHQVHSELRGTGDGLLTPQISHMSHSTSLARRITTAGATDPDFEVDWDGENDPENPWNWSLPYTGMCIGFLSWNTLVMYVPCIRKMI